MKIKGVIEDLKFKKFPRSEPFRFRFSGSPQRRRLGWACVLCPSQVRATQATRCLVRAVSLGGAVRLIASPVLAAQFPGCAVGAPSQVCVCHLWGADLWLRPS